MRIMDEKTNEKINKVLAILCEDTTLREALTISFSCCGAICESILDQVVHKEDARRAILDYCDMLYNHTEGYEPKPIGN